MRCRSCGHSNRTDEERCSQCGVELPVSVPSASSVSRWGEDETVLDTPSGEESDASPAPEPLRPGQRVGDLGDPGDGRYEVLRELARGGMGVVYLARDRRFSERMAGVNRRVVVKRVLDAGEHGVERFLRETRAVSTLEHENIVSIHDFGQDAEGPYIVMGYVEGGNLKTRVSGEGPLEDDDFYEVARGLARALDYVHEHHILHRDVKPSNVLMTREGLPKLSDFGLVRIGDDSDLSTTGHGMGTAAYAAPEQKRGEKDSDQRADLFGLGATLYYALTGESPRTIRESRVPDRWRQVILRCVEEEPEYRFADAKEFLRALEDARDDTSTGTGDLREGVRCANCSSFNRSSEAYCRQCGAGLFRHCPSCDVTGDASVRFCVHCGLDIDNWQASEEHLLDAQRFLEQSRYEEAMAAAARADAAYPGRREVQDVKALANKKRTALLNAWDRAEADDQAERYEQARRSWHRVLHYDPDNKRARAALAAADAHIRQRDLRRAAVEMGEACAVPTWPRAKAAMDRILALADPDDAARVVEAEELFTLLEERIADSREAFDEAFQRGDRGTAAGCVAFLEEIEFDVQTRSALRRQLTYLDAHEELNQRLASHDWSGARKAWSELARSADEERAPEVESLRGTVGELRELLLQQAIEEFHEALDERDFDGAEQALARIEFLEGNPKELSGLGRLVRHRRRKRILRRGQVILLQTLVVSALAGALSMWVLGLHEGRLERQAWAALDRGQMRVARAVLERSWDPQWPLVSRIVGTPLEDAAKRVELLERLMAVWPEWSELDPGPLGEALQPEVLFEQFVVAALEEGRRRVKDWNLAGADELVDELLILESSLALGTDSSGAVIDFRKSYQDQKPVLIDGLDSEDFERVKQANADEGMAGVVNLVDDWLKEAIEARDHQRIDLVKNFAASVAGASTEGRMKAYRRELVKEDVDRLRERLARGEYTAVFSWEGIDPTYQPGYYSAFLGQVAEVLAPLRENRVDDLSGSELSVFVARVGDAAQGLRLVIPAEVGLPVKEYTLDTEFRALSEVLFDRVRLLLDEALEDLRDGARGTFGEGISLTFRSQYPVETLMVDGAEVEKEPEGLGGPDGQRYGVTLGGLDHGAHRLEVELIGAGGEPRVSGTVDLVVDISGPTLLRQAPVTGALSGATVELPVRFDEPVGALDPARVIVLRIADDGTETELELAIDVERHSDRDFTLSFVPPPVPGREFVQLALKLEVTDTLGNTSQSQRIESGLVYRSGRLEEAQRILTTGTDVLQVADLLAEDLAVARPDYAFLATVSRAVRVTRAGSVEPARLSLGEGLGKALDEEATKEGMVEVRERARRALRFCDAVAFDLVRDPSTEGTSPADRVQRNVHGSVESVARLDLNEVGVLREDIDDLRAHAEQALSECTILEGLLLDKKLEDLDSLEAQRVQTALASFEVVPPPEAFVAWVDACVRLFEHAQQRRLRWPVRVLDTDPVKRKSDDNGRPVGGPEEDEDWAISEGSEESRLPKYVLYGPSGGIEFVCVPSRDAATFYIARTEVSVRSHSLFEGVLAGDSAEFLEPKTGVSWIDADLWCQNAGLRLPTSDEWSRAATAPTWSRSSWFSGAALLTGPRLGEEEMPYPVGVGAASRLDPDHPEGVWPAEPSDQTWCGALDMGANVRELCQDRLEVEGEAHGVLRGWSWAWRVGELPWSEASSLPESVSASDVGWRPVLELP